MKRTILTAALILGLGNTANAQEMINASDALDIVIAVRDLGYRATLEKDSVDDPMISSKASGLNFVVHFYGCTDHRDCQSIELTAGFSVEEASSTEAMNKWNAEIRYGRAYLDAENNPTIRYEINMAGAGISKDVFNSNFDIWETLLSDFKEHINY